MKRQNLFVRILLVLMAFAFVAALCGCEKDKQGEALEHTFAFTAVFADGKEEHHEVTTTAESLGDALEEAGLIDGEDGPYGLTVTTVCGVTVDFERESAYWAIYVNGEYALKGIDQIKCADVEKVELKVETF